jgi:N-glycosylase/DNA lyase
MLGVNRMDETLQKLYIELKPLIIKKMESFRETWQQGNKSIWMELCFCILTANTSAAMAITTLEKLRDVNFDNESEINVSLQKGYRFPNTRAHYISTTWEYLKNSGSLNLQEKISSFGSDKIALRDFFALTKSIKGLGYKESSHFLRNIGVCGLTILDKHILRSLHEFGLIETCQPPRNRTEYLNFEKIMKQFADKVEIDIDHLDLLLWYRKTGEILK